MGSQDEIFGHHPPRMRRKEEGSRPFYKTEGETGEGKNRDILNLSQRLIA